MSDNSIPDETSQSAAETPPVQATPPAALVHQTAADAAIAPSAYPVQPTAPSTPLAPPAAADPSAPSIPAAYPTAAYPTAPGYPAAAYPTAAYPGAQHAAVAPAASSPAYGIPGQPSPGQPAPGYAAPGYAAPGYAAPTYGAPVYGAPAYPAKPTSGVAVAAMICGIAGIALSWLTFVIVAPILISVAAIILGHIALSQLKKNPALGGKGMAVTGLVLGYIPVAIGILLAILGLIALLAFGAVTVPFLTS